MLTRRKIFYLALLVFFFWNILAWRYFMIKPQQPNNDDPLIEINRRVEKLENKLQHQSSLQDQIARIIREEANAKQNNVKAEPPLSLDDEPLVTAVLLIACNRVTVSLAIDQILATRRSDERFPLIVSQDCADKATKDVITGYGNKLTFIEQPDQSPIILPVKDKKFTGYYKLSRHYKWALDQVFFKMNYSTVIILEDDLNISPDFFEYFEATYPLLLQDRSLWCISAWNDNGKPNLISSDSELLYRSDFFPGLGWMMLKPTWTELSPKWPKAFWDDWMRESAQRKGRACIRPEVPRTSTFGKKGVSKGQFFEKHLKFIKHNEKFIPFTKLDLSYLLKHNYDKKFLSHVLSASQVNTAQVLSRNVPKTNLRINYQPHKKGFEMEAKRLGLMPDIKAGIPRTGYMGIVSCYLNEQRVYLSPANPHEGFVIGK